MKSSYYLKHVKKSSDDSIIESLIIYADNIEPQLRTDTNQILYWLDNYSVTFKDSLYVFNFYLNNEIIGYSQLTHFIDEKIVFVDYIVIHPSYRGNNTFFEFLEQMRNFLRRYVIVYDYVLAEVGSFQNQTEISKKSRNIIRLLKLHGFKVVKTKYYHPSLASKIKKQAFQSVLMLFTDTEIQSIDKNEYLKLIEVIYYKHYLRWYSYFLEDVELSEYVLSLNSLHELTKKNLVNKNNISVNGYSEIFISEIYDQSYNKIKPVLKWITIIILTVLLIFLFTSIHLIIKNLIKIEPNVEYYILMIGSLIITTIFLVVNENKNKKIVKLISKLFNLDL